MKFIPFWQEYSALDFACVDECSQCCIEREYYPTVEFGKIGVLVLPEEKKQLELFAEKNDIKIAILPRIAVSDKIDGPKTILAYQLMGANPDGNTCPFLDVTSAKRSPHGGYACKIYDKRPLACRAYPIIQSKPLEIDPKCKFCHNCGTPSGNVNSELESLVQIQQKMETKSVYIWRYATGIGESKYQNVMKTGWSLV